MCKVNRNAIAVMYPQNNHDYYCARTMSCIRVCLSETVLSMFESPDESKAKPKKLNVYVV